jgi:hypothetical protein
MPATTFKGRPDFFHSHYLLFWLAVVLAVCLLLVLTERAALQERPRPGGAGAGGLHAGFGEADITPDVGGKRPVYLAGFGHDRRATKVHDPLKARAVVLRHGGRKIALACVDVIGFFRANVQRVRARLPGFTYVLVSSTHNHEGPDTLGLWGPGPFRTGVDPAYLKKVEDAVALAVRQADRSARPVTARLGTARAPELLRDTRLPIVKHDELVALRFDAAGGSKPAGLVVQWNCHPETLSSGNKEVSADFVAATVGHLHDKYGCPVLYLTGTVGGLMTSLGVEVKDERGTPLKDGTFEKTWRYGKLVGELADRALAAAKPVRLTPLEARSREVFVPLDNKLYLLGWQLGVFRRQAFVWSGSPEKAQPLRGRAGKQRLCLRTEVAWLRLGELDVAAVPGEIYPELVLGKVQDPPDPGADYPNAPAEPAVYGQLRGPHRMIVGLANDEIGYIIPKRQWDERPPYCYGLKRPQYGEGNSIGPEAAPVLCNAFRALVRGKD